MAPIKLSAAFNALLSLAAAVPVQFAPSEMSQGISITFPEALYPNASTAIAANVVFPLVKHPLQPNETTLPVVYQNATGECNYAKATVRKEYSSLTKAQRTQYINAVQCLMDKPSVVPGVGATQSYYSDFAFLHINYARYTHFNGNFFGWHRHHVWLFEQALHDCGFPKNLGVPYMYWPMYGEYGFENSTIFDESPTSLGGNGWPTDLRDGNDRRVPHGTGGGCVMRGPFHDMVLNFQSFYDRYALPGLPDDWATPVERCLDRDLNQWLLQNNLNQTIYDGALAQPTLATFQNAADDPMSSFAMHVAGHGAVGMTMNDLFGGTIDPSFWLHHSSVDHLWNQWQEQDPARRHEYYGTDVVYNAGGNPVGPDTVLEFSTVGPRITLGEVQDPTSGPYCYRFEEPSCLDGRGCTWLPGH